MLRFINQIQRFTLQDLMQEFQISKRTALRDIGSLEEIGAPIYAEYGRYGAIGYSTKSSSLQLRLPVKKFMRFTSLCSTSSFSNLPFKISFRSIHEKFVNELPESERHDIERMQNRISFRHTEQIKDSAHLEALLLAAVKNKVLQINYQRAHQTSTRTIQPISIYSMKGYWYCQAYDLCKTAYRVFRCDRMTSVDITDIQPLVDVATLENAQSLWKPSEKAISFKCLVDQEGVESFQQEHYPSMKLIQEEEQAYIVGSYEPNELDFMVKFLAGFGESVKIIKPLTLKESLREYYRDLFERV